MAVRIPKKKSTSEKKSTTRKRGPDASELANSAEAQAVTSIIGLAMCRDGSVGDDEFDPALEYVVYYITSPYSEDLTPRQVEEIRASVRSTLESVIERVDDEGFDDAFDAILEEISGAAPQSCLDAALSVFSQDKSLDSDEAAFLARVTEGLGLDMASVLQSAFSSGWSAGWDQGWDSARESS